MCEMREMGVRREWIPERGLTQLGEIYTTYGLGRARLALPVGKTPNLRTQYG
jgi:hypothetical protein